ncbi:hypothetical protein [Pseudomonas putida]|uniref:hypothetical protein n=1 Tax=Pseudomonas putida TaxID=303 RepID=UPI0039E14934
MNISEPDVERLLARLQHVAEQAPPHKRPARRQIVRGMRAALSAVADGATLESLRNELLYELVGYVPDEPVVVRHGTADPLPETAEKIIDLLNRGRGINRICQEMGCSKSVVYRCKRLRDERAEAAQCEVE